MFLEFLAPKLCIAGSEVNGLLTRFPEREGERGVAREREREGEEV